GTMIANSNNSRAGYEECLFHLFYLCLCCFSCACLAYVAKFGANFLVCLVH
ncbi:hypothetical protein ACJX0J_013964, partial [Zea mays]